MLSSGRPQHLRHLLFAILAILAGAFQTAAAATGSLLIRWDANTIDPDLAFYRVYLSADAGVFNLIPSQAASQPGTLTVTVPATTTETTVTSLDPAKTYWVAVTALDTSSNESVFSDLASGRPRDLTLPTVFLTSPAASSTVSGTVAVIASATDDVGVVGVQFRLDGSALGAEVAAPPFVVAWDTTLVADGAHTLSAIARDAAGNSATSAGVGVLVDNSPVTCPDQDGDRICDAVDNCPAAYNPGQQNSDNDLEGGDACDITITYPQDGALTCADEPPTVVWSPEIYDLFKVYIGTTVSFKKKIHSGKKPLTTTSWRVPVESWRSICSKSGPYLFFKVLGKISGQKKPKEYSEIQPVRVK